VDFLREGCGLPNDRGTVDSWLTYREVFVMFSSLIAHLTEIVPSPALAAQPVYSSHNVGVLTEAAPLAAVEDQDQRQMFVGRWSCTGKKVVNGQELPYNGHMHNLWAIEKTWLFLDFKETQPAEGKPFAEHQYWGITQENGVNTRPMMTSTSGLAVVTSTGWQDNTSLWTGTYAISTMVLELTEKITIIDHNQFRMFGEMFLDGQSVGLYDVICTRKGSGSDHHNGTPTV
jgi:hypothetical protein